MADRSQSAAPSPLDELALFVDSVQDYAMFLLSPNGEVRSWNRGAARIFGYTAEEVIGRSFALFYPAEDIAQNKPARELMTASRDGRIEDEGWRVRKDGQRFWVDTVITALHDPSGELRGFAKVTRDLTVRRDAERRLRASEEMFRLLVDSVQDYAIFMLDPSGHVVSWNEGAHRIKGYEADEIIGQHFSVFYPEEDIRAGRPQRELQTAAQRGRIEDEGWRVRKDGSRFLANVIITAIHDEQGALRGFAKVTRDITERKKAEETQKALFEQREARLQAEEERQRAESSYRVAQEANRAKDEFLMTLSHELRTPMTAILGWARLLPSMSPSDPTFREAVTSIARGAQLQAHLIDDVLDVSRIVSGKMRLIRENVDVVHLLAASVEGVQPSAEAKGITIRTSLSPGLGKIIADSTRLQQVMWNLLSNAVKFTPKNGFIDVFARRTASHVQITVTDTGEGIDRDFLAHVFEPFRQAENPSTRVHGGLGLGLSIVRYIVEAHGGTVTAESRGRGTGATFTVILPISVLALSSREDSSKMADQPPLAMTTRLADVKILVVDDDRESREIVREALRQAGASVRAAESATEALAQIAGDRPDVIVTDIAMPAMDGYTFVRELRRQPESDGISIIALSAFPASSVAGEQTGFDASLTKPIDPYDLIEAIARIAGRAEESRGA